MLVRARTLSVFMKKWGNEPPAFVANWQTAHYQVAHFSENGGRVAHFLYFSASKPVALDNNDYMFQV